MQLDSCSCIQIIRDPVRPILPKFLPFSKLQVLRSRACSCLKQSSCNSHAGFLDMACQIIIVCPYCALVVFFGQILSILVESPTHMTHFIYKLSIQILQLLWLLLCFPFLKLRTGCQESGPKMQYKSQCITPLWHARLDACGQAKVKCTRSLCSLPER